MKIGFDISAQSLPRSGVGQYQINLLKALLAIDPDNFYHFYGFNLRNRERFSNIRFSASNYNLRLSPIPQRLITLWWTMFQFPPLENVAGKCDLYQVSEINIPPVKKAKTVAFVHDLTTLLFPQYHTWGNRFAHRCRFERLNAVDGILTNSHATKQDVIRHLSISSDRIFVTPLGADSRFQPMDPSGVDPILKKYGLTKPYLLFVGTLEPRKNLETLIRAFNQLKQTHHIPYQLILVGQKGWLFEPIFRAMAASPFSADIRWLNYVPDDDIPALMNGAEVFVYPSFYEGFGLPVLEAMQCGVPVITSQVSSLPEVGGDACRYIHPESSDELADTLFSALRNPALKSEMSKKGLIQSKKFSWERCARKTLEAYREVMGKN